MVGVQDDIELGEDEVAEEELKLLEVMAKVSQSLKQLNLVLNKLNRQTGELSSELRIAEHQMNALYLPFQATVYQIQNTPTTATTKTATTPIQSRSRTEL